MNLSTDLQFWKKKNVKAQKVKENDQTLTKRKTLLFRLTQSKNTKQMISRTFSLKVTQASVFTIQSNDSLQSIINLDKIQTQFQVTLQAVASQATMKLCWNLKTPK